MLLLSLLFLRVDVVIVVATSVFAVLSICYCCCCFANSSASSHQFSLLYPPLAIPGSRLSAAHGVAAMLPASNNKQRNSRRFNRQPLGHAATRAKGGEKGGVARRSHDD